jgi:hypothetical protein
MRSVVVVLIVVVVVVVVVGAPSRAPNHGAIQPPRLERLVDTTPKPESATP